MVQEERRRELAGGDLDRRLDREEQNLPAQLRRAVDRARRVRQQASAAQQVAAQHDDVAACGVDPMDFRGDVAVFSKEPCRRRRRGVAAARRLLEGTTPLPTRRRRRASSRRNQPAAAAASSPRRGVSLEGTTPLPPRRRRRGEASPRRNHAAADDAASPRRRRRDASRAPSQRRASRGRARIADARSSSVANFSTCFSFALSRGGIAATQCKVPGAVPRGDTLLTLPPLICLPAEQVRSLAAVDALLREETWLRSGAQRRGAEGSALAHQRVRRRRNPLPPSSLRRAKSTPKGRRAKWTTRQVDDAKSTARQVDDAPPRAPMFAAGLRAARPAHGLARRQIKAEHELTTFIRRAAVRAQYREMVRLARDRAKRDGGDVLRQVQAGCGARVSSSTGPSASSPRPAEYPRRGRGVAAIGPHGPSASRPRRRCDWSPWTTRVAAAASLRLVPVDHPRRGRVVAATRPPQVPPPPGRARQLRGRAAHRRGPELAAGAARARRRRRRAERGIRGGRRLAVGRRRGGARAAAGAAEEVTKP